MHSDNPPFYLNNLTAYHHRSPMKIGTDALLLGAYPKQINKNDQVLEIGSGCGIISMMTAYIHPEALYLGVDIDESSIEEYSQNIEINRLELICKAECIDIIDFSSRNNDKYNIVLSNPPFFTSAMLPEKDGLKKSKHTTTLSIESLARSTAEVLKENGLFYVILPIKESEDLVNELILRDMHLIEQCDIKSMIDKPVFRRIQVFRKGGKKENLILKQLTIYLSNKRNDWSDEYKYLLQDFKTFSY